MATHNPPSPARIRLGSILCAAGFALALLGPLCVAFGISFPASAHPALIPGLLIAILYLLGAALAMVGHAMASKQR